MWFALTDQDQKNAAGFTLVELLIVVTIIGVLFSLAIISFTGAQKQARDSQRKSDLNQYRAALENYANNTGGVYPQSTDQANADATPCETDLRPTYMSACLLDPKSDDGRAYYYRTNAEGPAATQYVLWADLEAGGYWLVCSDGRTGRKVSEGEPDTTGGNCDVD
jgi:general secretion pathway protein G